MWSSLQRRRLALDKSILEKFFAGKVNWINQTSAGNTKVEVQMTTSNNKYYTLRVYVPKDYPNACPTMVVSSHGPLRKRNGDTFGCCGYDHTLGTQDGSTVICHFRPSLWTAENTLYQVFMKGLLWLEAYEGHLRTGKSLSVYLKEMPG